MTDFKKSTSTENLRKTLTQWFNTARQRIELLKKKDGWGALVKPGHRRRPRKGRAGFTLTETLFVIIIVITVLAGLMALYNGVRNHLRNAALQSQMIRAVGVIERSHSYSGTYANVTLLGFLNDEGFNANEHYKDGDAYKFKTPYNTDITIDGDGARSFTMVVKDLPPAACKLAALAFRDSGSGLVELKINDGAAITLSPLNESSVDTACNAGAGGTSNVSLKF